MTPQELRDLAATMRELGVFKLTLPNGTVLEMSQHAIVQGAAERLAKEAPAAAEGPRTEPAPPASDDEDPMLYAATEGMPGDEG